MPEWRSIVEERLVPAMRTLLEQKHLYQSVTSKPTTSVINPAIPGPKSSPPAGIKLAIPDVKLFCAVCERVEAFNLEAAEDYLGRTDNGNRFEGSSIVQVFAASFLCQSCKRVPEVFLIRRTGWRLTLCGRAPMEVAGVPRVIPKAVRRFFGGAIVAHQSGQTLAGVFMLRTVIEQWARSCVQDPPAQADQLLEAYMTTLPPDFRDRFPSMRTLYGDLRVDIHGAVGSAELFERASGQIVEHFDARRLFKLPEPTATVQPKAD